MQILIDVDQSPAGRLTGTAAQAGDVDALPFSGNLELLARIEELCRHQTVSPYDPSNPTDPGACDV